jgi:exopolysaccharide production protein ExoQ
MRTTSFLDSKAFERFEKFFVIASIVAFAGAILPTNTVENQGSADANHFSIAIQLAVFPVLSVLALIHFRRILNAIRSMPWVVALCALALASVAWSYDPVFTLRRTVVLMAFTLLGVYIGANFERDEQIKLFAWALLYMVVVSLLIIIVAPDYGISHDLHSGAWKGVFPHKNSLGRVIGFGLVLLIFARPKIGPTIVRVGLLLATALLLIFSFSSTALVSVVGCLLAYPFILVLRARAKRTVPLWVVLLVPALIVVVLVGINYATVATLFGKDPTLSGRTELWAAVVDAIKLRPWFGYGYAVFWGKPGLQTLATASASAYGSVPVHAHDGYLDLALDLGIVGVLIFAYGLIKMIWLAVSTARDESYEGSAWPLMFVVYYVLFNVTESNLLISRAFLWLPFIATYVTLVREYAVSPGYEPEESLPGEYATAQ